MMAPGDNEAMLLEQGGLRRRLQVVTIAAACWTELGISVAGTESASRTVCCDMGVSWVSWLETLMVAEKAQASSTAAIEALNQQARPWTNVTQQPIHAHTATAVVASELRKMTAFIRQEALEKAREIHLKADEEFAIEKSQLVRQETQSIDAQYEKKFKQASMSQQITKSTLSNKTRLRLLSARQELLDDLFEQANNKLADSAKDQAKYQDILKNLILEGLYALNESKISVRCRSKDDHVVRKAADAAQAEYKEKMNGRETDIKIDDKNKLPEETSGGVTIVNSTGRIDINNTFEERLRLLQSEALPSVRATLFGENKNRKFKD
ncbi:vacuolar ATP synthase subunit E [Aureobasidium pullulans]|uniref:Vacuolar ATP synthase subunit E n=1 Tax=Aureobasidium pullulans TaxID=5580 RepID=A0A4S9LYU3_AURPU|nr:vacuolar ATP synthase subunit E [Aureobasidium pullulans]